MTCFNFWGFENLKTQHVLNLLVNKKKETLLGHAMIDNTTVSCYRPKESSLKEKSETHKI